MVTEKTNEGKSQDIVNGHSRQSNELMGNCFHQKDF
jgi:hypothetical protein